MTKFIITIFVLCLVVYTNSINGEFVSDDIAAIVNNPRISDISAYRDLPSLSNTIIYKIFKLNPSAHHLLSILIHSLNSVLVFYLLLIFFGVWPSFLGALLFSVHPIHAEAVSWISGRSYLLSTLFVLSSFLLYRRATSQNKIKIGAYLFSIIFHIVSIFTSWHAFFYPVMIMLFDFTYGRARRNWRLWLSFIFIVLIWFLLKNYTISQRIISLQIGMDNTAMSNPLFNMAFSLFHHLGLILWPIRLTLYHEPLRITPQALAVEVFFLSLLLCLLPILFKKAKPIFFAICLFIIFLIPTYSPVLIAWLVAERYAYFSSIGFCILVSFFLDRFASSDKKKDIATVFLIILIGAYSIRTIIRNNDWRDAATLWRATVKVSPQSPKAHNNMGDVYTTEGDLEKAAQSFARAIELRPNYADAYNNLGNTYQKMGRIDEAIALYKKAISLNPQLYPSYKNLGAIYFNRKDFDLAKVYFQKAFELNPEDEQLKILLKKLEN